MSSGSDIAANALLPSLLDGVDFTFPEIDLDDPQFAIPTDADDEFGDAEKLTNADLTTGVVNGDGTFDAIMKTFDAHLKGQFDKSRITGAEYSKAYIALVQAAIGGGIQFLLGRDQAYWQAVAMRLQAKTAGVQLVTARVQLEQEKAKLQTIRYEMLNAKVAYALMKVKLATEDATYGTAVFNLTNVLPAQLELVSEQVEGQRAQTLDTRTDGAAVAGSVGSQKALYAQQVTSYKRDAEVKAAKLFTDAWITMKTIDEGVVPPDGFINTSLDEILTALKVNNAIGA